MTAIVAAAALTCVGALVLGQAACWLCGARTWTFLSAPVGLGVLLLFSIAAVHVPGHAGTVIVVILLAIAAGLLLLVLEPSIRPRPTDLLTAAPAAFLALVPFLASSRAGTLGVSFDNDMASHLLWAEAIRSPSVARVTGLDSGYPIGPHALSAALAQGLGERVDYAFAGVTMAAPIMLAFTALGALKKVGWPGKALVATMTGMTFLVAGFYGQGSFKEVMQALFVLGFALGVQSLLSGEQPGRLRWVPLALIVGGALSVYSIGALPWLVGVLALWILILGARRMFSGPLRAVIASLRPAITPALIALGVLGIALVPQLPRLVKFYEVNASVGGGSGIPTSSLGNLAGPVSFWKIFGLWDIADYRLGAIDAFQVGMLAGVGAVLAVLGTLWWIRYGGLAVPLATGVATLIWVYADGNQSPYVAAKALVILAPLVMLVSTRWLVELRPAESWLSSRGLARIVVVGSLAWFVLGTSVKALRYSFVGPTTHVSELRELQPVLGDARTLLLGRDDFIEWELAGTPVVQPFLYAEAIPLQPQKAWAPGQTLDFDDIPPAVLDRFAYVVGPRDPAGSQPPSNMKLVRTTRFFAVWRRIGPTPHRQILNEGQHAGATLDCHTPQGRMVARLPGEAAVRSPSIEVPVAPQGPGSTVSVVMQLTAGTWLLSSPYTSPHSIDVRGPGLSVVLPSSRDRFGNRWLIGRMVVARSGPVKVTLHVQGPSLAGPDATEVGALLATPEQAISLVPLARACGSYVDWYTTR